jgi:hypothetical protein
MAMATGYARQAVLMERGRCLAVCIAERSEALENIRRDPDFEEMHTAIALGARYCAEAIKGEK